MAKKRRRPTQKNRQSYAKSQTAHRTLSFVLVVMFVLLLASIFSVAYAIYYFKSTPPSTSATGYVDSLSYAPEQTYAIEVNYFDNSKKNGVLALEYRWNYYTDTLIPTTDSGVQNAKDNATTSGKLDTDKLYSDLFKVLYSSGMQMIDTVQFELVRYQQPALLFGDFRYCSQPANAYYYNTTSGTSYTAINNLDYKDKWIIDFGAGQLGRVVQDKEAITLNEHPFGNSYYRMDINKFMRDVFDCVSSLKYGKQVLMFDLSDYFVFEYFSTDDLKFHRPETDEQHLYMNILVNKSENGLIDKSQSLFGVVKGDSNWNYTGVQPSDYWQNKTVININETDFVVENNLFVLKPDAKKYYQSFNQEDLVIDVLIDITNLDVLGFGENAFSDLKIHSIIVTSDVEKSFSYSGLSCTIVANSNVTLVEVTK